MKNSIKAVNGHTQSLVKTAVVAAMYVAITLALPMMSFGVIQIRLAEMFNYLVLFNRRYVWGVTLGVFLANFASPTWTLDVPIGTLSTFLVLLLVRWLARKLSNLRWQLVVTALVVTLSMFTIAAELHWIAAAPFWWSWLTIGLGELLSMSIGGILIELLSKRIDLTK